MKESIKNDILIPVWDLLQSQTRLDTICLAILDRVIVSMDCERASIFFVDREQGEIYTFVGHLPEKEMISIPIDKGIVGVCIRQREPVIENAPYDNPVFFPDIDTQSGLVTHSLLAVPLVEGDEVFGAIEFLNKRKGEFGEDEAQIGSELASQITEAVKNSTLWQKLHDRKPGSLGALNRFNRIIGESEPMKRMYTLIEKAAVSDVTVLLMGRSGTGKTLIARAIAENGSRRDAPFVYLDCTTIPENLFESELFGYEKGAFTGADSTHIGKLESSNRGTLFLDEIGELPLSLQPKLLRFIQERKFERVGGTRTIEVDSRLIFATNRNLREMVEKRTFREDLFYRLSVFEIDVPTLAERGHEDILLLADYFIQKYKRKYGYPDLEPTGAYLNMLSEYHWPGNVRELDHAIESAIAVSEGDLIFTKPISKGKQAPAKERKAREERKTFEDIESAMEYIFENMTLQSLERALMVHAMNRKMSRGELAEFLGVSRSTLWRKLKSLGLEVKYFYKG